jgi:hypothetical protein
MSLFVPKKRKQPEKLDTGTATESSKIQQTSITGYFFGSPHVFPRVHNPPTEEERAVWEVENAEHLKIQQDKLMKATKKKSVLLEQSTLYNIKYKPWPACGGKLGIKDRYLLPSPRYFYLSFVTGCTLQFNFVY